jgi:hypothetical protein
MSAPGAPSSSVSAVAEPSSRPLTIFNMNTKAVLSLKHGKLEEAMMGLRDSLIHIRSILQRHQNQEQEQEEKQSSTKASDACASRAVPSLVSFSPCPLPPNSNSSDSMVEDDAMMLVDDEPLLSLFSISLSCPCSNSNKLPAQTAADLEASAHCPLFDRAFVLGNGNGTEEFWLAEDVHCQNVTLGVLLYNLGLSHQLMGLARGNSQEFHVALHLYQMALSLLESSLHRQQLGPDQPHEESQTCVSYCAPF